MSLEPTGSQWTGFLTPLWRGGMSVYFLACTHWITLVNSSSLIYSSYPHLNFKKKCVTGEAVMATLPPWFSTFCFTGFLEGLRQYIKHVEGPGGFKKSKTKWKQMLFIVLSLYSRVCKLFVSTDTFSCNVPPHDLVLQCHTPVVHRLRVDLASMFLEHVPCLRAAHPWSEGPTCDYFVNTPRPTLPYLASTYL